MVLSRMTSLWCSVNSAFKATTRSHLGGSHLDDKPFKASENMAFPLTYFGQMSFPTV